MNGPILEREPGEKEFDPVPADHSEPPVNPPAFRWLTHEGIVRWRVELRGPEGQELAFGPLRDPVLALPKRLSPGRWTWQFIGLDAAGNEVGRGRERTFRVRRGLRGFAVPDVRALERRWRGLRPRLFGRRIAALREHLDGPFAAPFRRLQAWCDLAAREALIPEPGGFRPFPSDSEEHDADWKRIFSAGKVASAHALRFALSYLLTDNADHLALAKRWTMHLLSWNPWGSTSLAVNDEAGMPMLERLGFLYDWLHPHWTEFERERFLEVMLIRGEEARERDRQVGFAGRPFFNHQCRTIGFTGTAAVALLGELPQAREWLEYVLRVLAVSYPSGSWGSDDGAWGNGLSYWAAYMARLVRFVAAASELGIDFAAAPYYRNTGYYAVYLLPPYAPAGGFGDGCTHPPVFDEKLVVGSFGAASSDGYLRAYADAIEVPRREPAEILKPDPKVNLARRWEASDTPEVFELLLSPAPDFPAKDLRELPAARLFPNAGRMAMHSALGDAENDTWLQFKSSPFGSVSHNHADQNGIRVFAYGEELLIDSGYYPWYSSPHDALWTNQSWAHNMVLVGGHGQPPYDWFARGQIEAFFDRPPFAGARGEAAEAYNRPPNPQILELAEKHCPELVDRMGPATEVRRASRTVLMVNGPAPYYVVLDWIETADPVAFQWLAHAHEEMHIDGQAFEVRRNAAGLRVCFAWPQSLSLRQDDRFLVPPEGRAKGAPNQWHLTAETVEASTTARFLAVLLPHRADEVPLPFEVLTDGDCIGARVGDDLVLAPREGPVGAVRHGTLEAHAAAVVLSAGKLLVAEATRLAVAGKVLVESPEPVTLVRRAPRLQGRKGGTC